MALCTLAAQVSAQCNTSNNLALNKTVVASSSENGGTLPENAVDGNPSTRWSSTFSDPQYITVDLGSIKSLCEIELLWEHAYATDYQIDISTDQSNWTTIASITGNTTETNTLSVSGTGRFVRLTGLTRATQFGYSLFEFEIFGTTSSQPCPINLALGRPAFDSDEESNVFPPGDAFDGNSGTRWSSAFNDDQFIYVDLGAKYPVCTIEINWEAAYGNEYRIDVSDDALSWTTEAHVVGNTSLNNTIPVTANARYVRMYGIRRATQYGYSIWEVKVFGNSIILPVKWVSFDGRITAERNVNLSWTTADETGSAHFEVQRKTGTDADFITIGTVPSQTGAGNRGQYHFTDGSSREGMNYYRIRQVDVNGHAGYSKTIGLDNKMNTSCLSVYPNPVVNQVFVKDQAQAIDYIRVFSSEGRMLQEVSRIAKGQQAAIQLGSYPKGTYLVQIVTAKGVETRKIIKE